MSNVATECRCSGPAQIGHSRCAVESFRCRAADDPRRQSDSAHAETGAAILAMVKGTRFTLASQQ